MFLLAADSLYPLLLLLREWLLPRQQRQPLVVPLLAEAKLQVVEALLTQTEAVVRCNATITHSPMWFVIIYDSETKAKGESGPTADVLISF